MRAAELPDALTSALDELAGLADESDTAVLTALRERLRAARLRVLVVGEAKRGKSTLVNALLGREVLPTGATPLTAVPTTVTYGTREATEVAFADGRTAHCPLSALGEFGTERGNPGNSRGVAAITVRLDSPILARGVEIVDTPGTGSVHAHNTAAADGVLPTMDAAIFVLAADPPVSAAERDLLERVHGLSVTTFVVLNKADYADAAGLAEAVEFTERIAGQAVGAPVRVYPVSARAALSGAGDAGFTAFAADLGAYLDTGRTADLRRSAAGQLGRVASAGIDEIALARRAAEMRSSDAAGRVTVFTARLAAVRERGTAAADLAAAESRRMLAGLNEAAELQSARLAGELRAAIGRLLDGELAASPPVEIERQGRDRLARLAVEGAESWRQEQRERLEDGLAALDDRLTRDLAAELGKVRDAAADLLGLELATPGPQERLAPDRRFFYSVAESVDQAELLAGAVRRRLPGELGRRLARDHVLGEVSDQAERQIGRARADLQQRLAEATRQLVLAAGRRYSGSTDRLARALQTAAVLREQTAGQAAGTLAGLAGREQALRGVLARLERLERLDGGGDGQDDR
jgi:small GTP-binding protein